MNKEVKFSRFVGVAIVIICIWVVVLALMSAMLKTENNDNIIDVDEGLDTILNMPKSNIITNYIDMEKELITETGVVDVNITLPKINIDTKVVDSINEKIYNIYQETYGEILKSSNMQKIYIDYTYEYLDNGTVIEITVMSKVNINSEIEEEKNKFTYDLKNDKEIIE